MGNGKGYVGYSKSVNAYEAEEEGKFPLTHAAKILSQKASITQKEAKRILKEIGPSEWHHTSKFYNKTDYYDVNEAILYHRHEALIKEVKSLLNEYSKNKKSSFIKDLSRDTGIPIDFIMSVYHGSYEDIEQDLSGYTPR